MGQLTQTTAQVQVILDDADAANVGKTSLTDSTDTTAVAVRKSGFYSLGASSSNAPSTDRAILISAVRDTTATGEIRYGQVAITESNGMWWNRDDGGTLGTWYEAVSTAGTQTLTNKTLTSPVLTTPQINDTSADHQYVFAVSELAADRTVTLPLLTGNDTFVFEAHTQTLTNKTLTSPVFNTSVSGTAVLDDDTFNTASSTTLATSESIKAYVDATVTGEDLDFAGDTGTGAVDLDSQVFTIAGTANEIETAASSQTLTIGLPDSVTITTALSVDTVNEKTAAAGVTVDSLLIKDGGITAAGTSTFAGQTISDLGTVTTANIDGGSIDGTTIGASTAAAITGTTITATDDVTLTGASYNVVWDSSDNALEFAANAKAVFDDGAGGSLQIYHNGSRSVITDQGTGPLRISATNLEFKNADDTKLYANAIDGGAFNLYYDNSKKLETTSTGIDVTGTVTADGLTVSAPSGDTPASIVTTTTGAFLSISDTNTTAGCAPLVGVLTDDLVFYTSDGSYGEKVRIKANGNVGIGTTSPGTKLSVVDTSAAAVQISLQNSGRDWRIGPNSGVGSSSLTFYDNTASQTRLVIDSSGNVIAGGTSAQASDAVTLMSDGEVTAAGFYFSNNIGSAMNDTGIRRATTSTMVFDTGSTERMRIDSSGGVIFKGALASHQTNAGVAEYESNGFTLRSYGATAGTGFIRFLTGGGGGSAASETMRIDSSGRIGIGGTPNTNWRNDIADQEVLQLGTEATFFSDGGVTTELWNNAYVDNADTFYNISTRGASRYQQYSGAHKWFTAASATAPANISTEINTTPKMTLDVSGNLLVGNTITNPASGFSNQRGFGYTNSTGKVEIATTANDAVIEIGKNNTNDGSLAVFRKEGTVVGSIGVINSDNLRIGGSVADHAGLQFALHEIVPMEANADSDGTISLGSTNSKFKDLYLSGGIQFDSRSNKLDDYEEGTWTPTYSPQSSAFTSITYDAAVYGKYVKVGAVVHIQGIVRTDAISGGSGAVYIGGLPFTADNYGVFSIGYTNGFTGDNPGGLYTSASSTDIIIRYRTAANSALDNLLDVTDLNTGGNSNYIIFSGTYMTTQ